MQYISFKKSGVDLMLWTHVSRQNKQGEIKFLADKDITIEPGDVIEYEETQTFYHILEVKNNRQSSFPKRNYITAVAELKHHGNV